jgi:gentisate 1,2-dioxygenase
MNLWRAHSHSHRRFILIFSFFGDIFNSDSQFWKTFQFVLGPQNSLHTHFHSQLCTYVFLFVQFVNVLPICTAIFYLK